mgnify:CR=1
MVSYTLNNGTEYHPSGLNPCCSGQWSRTSIVGALRENEDVVLILVVVDNGLVLANNEEEREIVVES